MLITVAGSRYEMPPGVYPAVLRGIKPLPASVGPNGEPRDALYAWEFEVTEGPQAGKRPSALTPQYGTTRNGLGRLLRGLLGRPVGPDERVELAAFVGRPFAVTVGFNATGLKTRVTAAVPRD
jgi:hypothetical protein